MTVQFEVYGSLSSYKPDKPDELISIAFRLTSTDHVIVLVTVKAGSVSSNPSRQEAEAYTAQTSGGVFLGGNHFFAPFDENDDRREISNVGLCIKKC